MTKLIKLCQSFKDERIETHQEKDEDIKSETNHFELEFSGQGEITGLREVKTTSPPKTI